MRTSGGFSANTTGRERRRVAATRPPHRPAGFGRQPTFPIVTVTRWLKGHQHTLIKWAASTSRGYSMHRVAISDEMVMARGKSAGQSSKNLVEFTHASPIRICASPEIRTSTHPQIRIHAEAHIRFYGSVQKHKSSKAGMHKLGEHACTKPEARAMTRASGGPGGREHKKAPRRRRGTGADAQSALLRDQSRLCVPSSSSIKRA